MELIQVLRLINVNHTNFEIVLTHVIALENGQRLIDWPWLLNSTKNLAFASLFRITTTNLPRIWNRSLSLSLKINARKDDDLSR